MRHLKTRVLRILSYFNLSKETEDYDFIHQEILKGIAFKGTNLWILIFAIFVASVGLNMNSTAVIIGAMLISPLMGPINGMGYSIATYDFELFKLSVKNFTFAVITSLVTSTLYFALSPVSTAQSELLARTSPTIYDVLIALFGGLAGIIAITSKNKGNVIPGVAIATALMPPLCTAGYGLATLQPQFFFGAFYLFSINTIFIALAALWVSQLLNFPIRTILDKKRKKNVNQIITFVILIVLLPSFYFGYQLVLQEKFTQNANKFIANVSYYDGNFLMKHIIEPSTNKIELIYGGNALTNIQKEDIKTKALNFNLSKDLIIIKQGLNLSDFFNENAEEMDTKEQISLLKKSLEKYETQKTFADVLFDEIKIINPQLKTLTYVGEAYNVSKDSIKRTKNIPLIILELNKNNLDKKDLIILENWIKKRIQDENAVVIIR